MQLWNVRMLRSKKNLFHGTQFLHNCDTAFRNGRKTGHGIFCAPDSPNWQSYLRKLVAALNTLNCRSTPCILKAQHKHRRRFLYILKVCQPLILCELSDELVGRVLCNRWRSVASWAPRNGQRLTALLANGLSHREKLLLNIRLRLSCKVLKCQKAKNPAANAIVRQPLRFLLANTMMSRGKTDRPRVMAGVEVWRRRPKLRTSVARSKQTISYKSTRSSIPWKTWSVGPYHKGTKKTKQTIFTKPRNLPNADTKPTTVYICEGIMVSFTSK